MRILLIEDDERLAELIKRGLTEEGFDVTVAYDGQYGKKLAISGNFDIIIMDIILPKINGIDLCREIRLQLPEIPVIMLTALGSIEDKLEGFDAGTDDYMVKPFEMRELVARIRSIIKRRSKDSQKRVFVLRYADLEMNLHTKEVKRNNIEIKLTPKEFKLLEYMLNNPERVLTRAEIAEKVWNTYFDTGTNFIDVYINYLRKKIDKGFEKKLIHTKQGMGFILKEEK